MSVEPAESAAIRVIWRTPGYLYDLRWYGSADYVVPLWWLGFVDSVSGELERTEIFHSDPGGGPPALYRWLEDLTGHESAVHLVSAAASATSTRGAAVP